MGSLQISLLPSDQSIFPTFFDALFAKNEIKLGDDRVNLLRKQNADFQAMKKGDITKADFIKQYPKSQTAIKSKLKALESYEPYHIVLGYLLHEGHADSINEAHYVMTQMDEETVQDIVALDEIALGTAAGVAGVLTLGGMGLNAIRKMYQNKKTMDQGGEFKKGSTLDNIQKKNQIYKDFGIAK